MAEIAVLGSKLASLAKPDFWAKKYPTSHAFYTPMLI